MVSEAELEEWLLEQTGKRLSEYLGATKAGKLYSAQKAPINNQQITNFLFSRQISWADRHRPESLNELIGNVVVVGK